MSIILANFGKYAISDCPFIQVFISNKFMLKSQVNMACDFSFDSLDIIGFICWMKLSVVGFELLFLGGL